MGGGIVGWGGLVRSSGRSITIPLYVSGRAGNQWMMIMLIHDEEGKRKVVDVGEAKEVWLQLRTLREQKEGINWEYR